MFTPEFLLTSLIVVLIPGTGVVYTITTGITMKWRASLAAAIGCTLGIIPHILACILGLSTIMNMSAQVFTVIKWAGSAYLLYLAWTMWQDAGRVDLSRKNAETRIPQIILKAITINLLNPKLTIFFLAFLPQFVSNNSSAPVMEMILLSIIFMIITLVVFALYGILASGISAYIMKSSRVLKRIQRVFAVMLAGFAVQLALSDE